MAVRQDVAGATLGEPPTRQEGVNGRQSPIKRLPPSKVRSWNGAMFENIIGLVVGIAVVCYLFIVVTHPERF